MDNLNNENEALFQVTVNEEAKRDMLETSRWTKFLAILGFVFTGLFVVVALFAGAFFSTMNSGSSGLSALGGVGIAAMYVAIAALYFYPTLMLFKYATNIKTALTTGSQQQFNLATRYLKNMFKYMGILIIVLIAVYVVAIIVMIGFFATK